MDRRWLVLLVALTLACPSPAELNLLSRGDDAAQASASGRSPALRHLPGGFAGHRCFGDDGRLGSAFVGLVVPHLVAIAIGNDQRLLLLASVLAGGSLLVLADTAGPHR